MKWIWPAEPLPLGIPLYEFAENPTRVPVAADEAERNTRNPFADKAVELVWLDLILVFQPLERKGFRFRTKIA